MHPTRRALLFAATAAVAAGACKNGAGPASAPKNEVVARVAGRPITRSYFEQRLAKMDRRYLPDTLDLAGKRKFLDFIVNKELMALKAEELKYGEDPRVVQNMQLYGDRLAERAAIDHLCAGKLDASDADIDAFQKKRANKVLTKHILVRTRREAAELRKQLEAGAHFDSLAARYSMAPRVNANTGEEIPWEKRLFFGSVQFGEAIIPVEEAVFGTAIDQVSEPVETGYGWHLFKPISMEQVSMPTPDSEGRRRIATQIQLRRKRLITEDYWAEIAKDHGYSIDDEAVAFLFDKFPPDADPSEAPDPKTEVKPVLGFTQAERERPLFELEGKTYTIGDFCDRYDATSWFERPKRVTGALGVKYWIRDKWMKQIQLDRARKDGIYDLPEVADEVKLRREQMMVAMLHENLVGSQAPEPTEDQLREFYEQHAKFYVDKEKRHVNIIFNAQERVVRRALEEIEGGKSFVEVAVRYNEGATKPEDVQTVGFSIDTPEFKEIAPRAFALEKVGDRTEPFKTSTFWVMLQLAHIAPERQLGLDEIRENVAQDWKNQWTEGKLNELLAQWKTGVKIEVDEDALGRTTVSREDVFVPGRPAPAAVSPGGGSSP
jgi:peptidyl-prolyl cis-trans isomerase C